MKGKNIFLFIGCSLIVGGVAIALAPKSAFSTKAGEELYHDGNHYIGVSATQTETGVHDYYVCCTCHETFLDKGSINNVWKEAGTASDDTVNYVRSNPTDIRYAPNYVAPLTSNGAFIYGNGGETIIKRATGEGKAVFSETQVNAWIDSGVPSISFKLSFTPATKDGKQYKTVVNSKVGEYLSDTTGEKTYEVSLTRGRVVSLYTELGSEGADIPFTLTEFKLGKAVESITLSDYTDSVKFGKPYKYDGKVTVNYEDGTKEVVTNYSVDYSTLDRFHTGPNTVTVSYADKVAQANVNVTSSDELKVLMIGNSFSIDTMQWSYRIAKSLGVNDIKIVNMAIGGCSLATHWNNIQTDGAKYEHYIYENGWRCDSSTAKLSDAIKEYDWDFISFQQVSNDSGMPNSYEPYITNIATWLKNNATNKDVNLVWNMTWAYQSDSTHAAFPNYSNNQMTMYNAICNTVQTKAEKVVDVVVPNGTAIQNARTSYKGDTLTRDGFHLDLELGRYIAGLTFVSKLTGQDPTNATYMSPGMVSSDLKVAVESSKNAIDHPYQITNSKYLTEPKPEDDLFEYGPVSYTDGYYWNIQEGYQLTAWSNTFCASQAFTKETLPVGSLIKIADGYQIRIERYSDFDFNLKSSRFNNNTGYVSITQDLWEDYKYMAFNVSKIGNASMNGDYESTHNAIKIYTPTQMEIENVTYLKLGNVSSWTSGNPEINVEGLGLPKLKNDGTISDSSKYKIFSAQTVNSFPSWCEVTNGTPANSEYAFSAPLFRERSFTNGEEIQVSSKCFLFRINGKTSSTRIRIKGNESFTQNGHTYQFDKDYTLVYDGTTTNSSWSVEEVTTLGVSNAVYTWSSGNPTFIIKYLSNNPNRMMRTSYATSQPSYMDIAGGCSFTNLSYGFATDYNADISSKWLLRVANPTTIGASILFKGGVEFRVNGFRYVFDKDYQFVRKSDGWATANVVINKISVTDVFTWTNFYNIELKITYPTSDMPRIETSGASDSTQPSYLKITNSLQFSNIQWNFNGPSMHQSVSECLLIRFVDGTKVEGSQFQLLANKSFTFGENTYQFDRDYTFTFTNNEWVME